MHLNELRDITHQLAVEKGWYDKQETTIQYVTRCVANIHGEISELWESARKGSLHKPCDKNCNLTQIEEELADIIIRVLDMAGELDIDIETAVMVKHEYNSTREYRHGNKCA